MDRWLGFSAIGVALRVSPEHFVFPLFVRFSFVLGVRIRVAVGSVGGM